jgi:hypothetical protein
MKPTLLSGAVAVAIAGYGVYDYAASAPPVAAAEPTNPAATPGDLAKVPPSDPSAKDPCDLSKDPPAAKAPCDLGTLLN